MLQRLQKEHIRPRSKNNLPWPGLRQDFSWVESRLICLEIENQIAAFESELDIIRKRPRALSGVKKDFERSYQNAKDRQVFELQQFIKMFAGSPDPASNFRYIHDRDWLKIPDISEQAWNDAFDALEKSWPADSITDAERKKSISAINKKIAALKKELEKYPDRDKWAEFTDHWARLQGSADAALNPQGFYLLKASEPEEVEAYRKLEIGKLVSEKNRYHPARS